MMHSLFPLGFSPSIREARLVWQEAGTSSPDLLDAALGDLAATDVTIPADAAKKLGERAEAAERENAALKEANTKLADKISKIQKKLDDLAKNPATPRSDGTSPMLESRADAPAVRAQTREFAARGVPIPPSVIASVVQGFRRTKEGRMRIIDRGIGRTYTKQDGRFVDANTGAVADLRADGEAAAARAQAARMKEVTARAEHLRDMQESRTTRSSLDTWPTLSREEQKESALGNPNYAAAAQHLAYAERDGGVRDGANSVSYAPGQAKFRPDDDGGTYGTSSTLGRTTYDRQVGSPRFQREQEMARARRSNDTIIDRELPRLKIELAAYFKEFHDAIDRAKKLRDDGENEKAAQAMPASPDFILEQSERMNRALTRGLTPSEQYHELKVIQQSLERLQSQSLRRVPYGAPNPGPDRLHLVAMAESHHAEAAETDESVGKTFRIDMRSDNTAGVKAVTIEVPDGFGGKERIVYEAGENRTYDAHHADLLRQNGIRIEKHMNNGITQFVTVMFTKPGTYRLNDMPVRVEAKDIRTSPRTVTPEERLREIESQTRKNSATLKNLLRQIPKKKADELPPAPPTARV